MKLLQQCMTRQHFMSIQTLMLSGGGSDCPAQNQQNTRHLMGSFRRHLQRMLSVRMLHPAQN